MSQPISATEFFNKSKQGHEAFERVLHALAALGNQFGAANISIRKLPSGPAAVVLAQPIIKQVVLAIDMCTTSIDNENTALSTVDAYINSAKGQVTIDSALQLLGQSYVFTIGEVKKTREAYVEVQKSRPELKVPTQHLLNSIDRALSFAENMAQSLK